MAATVLVDRISKDEVGLGHCSPEDFPTGHKLAFVPESKQVVVEHDLPSFDVIPEEKGFKYVKSRDEITAAARAQMALRAVHELCEADRREHVETVVYNAMAESFVNTFKTELLSDRVWRTRSQLELALVEYVAWFNNERLHESLGDLPPAEFEDLYVQQGGREISLSK